MELRVFDRQLNGEDCFGSYRAGVLCLGVISCMHASTGAILKTDTGSEV